MNKTQLAKTFLFYGIFLILIGILGYVSNPEKAKTALLSGGTFGLLNIALSFFIDKGAGWPRRLGLGLSSFLSLVFAWRASVSWLAVIQGNDSKVIAASLITLMLVASLVVARKSFRAINH
jgi:uncharacterized membrane protein (UPF0136 family)